MSAYKRKVKAEMEAQAAKAAQKCVMICVPAGDMCSTGFAYDLASMVGCTVHNAPDTNIVLNIARGTILPSLRTSLVKEALNAPGVTHILWLDSDMRFPKETLIHLLAREKDIVGASYATRRYPVEPVSFDKTLGQPGGAKAKYFVEPNDEGVFEVGATGMGVLLTSIKVFEQTPKPWFALGYAPESEEFQGEDIWFMLRAKEAGFTTYVDAELSKMVQHLGEFAYSHEEIWSVRDALKEQQ